MPDALDIDPRAEHGVALLAEGRYAEARTALRLAVAVGRTDPATVLNLALAENATGDTLRARALMRGLADRLPDWEEPLIRLAESHRARGEAEAAMLAYRHALDRAPRRREALLGLAGLCLAHGDPAKSRELLLRCLGVDPDCAEAWDALGLALTATREPGLALSAFAEACRLAPASLDYALRCVDAAQDAAQRDAEEARWALARLRDPSNPVPHAAHGVLLERLGRRAEAIDALTAAHALAPDAPAPALLLGGLLARSTRLREAEAALRRAGELDPDNDRIDNDRAAVLMRMHRHAEAERLLRGAVERWGPTPVALCNWANALACQGRQAEAVRVARSAIAAWPDATGPRRALCNTLPYLSGTTGADLLEAGRACGERLPRPDRPQFVMGGLDPPIATGAEAGNVAAVPMAGEADPFGGLRTAAGARAGAESVASGRGFGILGGGRVKPAHDAKEHGRRPRSGGTGDPERRLTVGLLSGSLKSHPVGWLTVAAFETLDPDAFELVCLGRGAAPDDLIARRFRAAAADWIDTEPLSDHALMECARARGIDILIDLGGYGDSGRLPACALRLAPVQIKWVGMQTHSTGLAEMDWFLTDRWESPPGSEALYSERLLLMPDGYVCYSPPAHAPDVGPSPILRDGFPTFGCFNNLAKIGPDVLLAWRALLDRLPTARLVLKAHQFEDAETAERVRGAFGSAAARVETRGSSGHRAFMAQYNDIDIALDPFPYSGGLTTCEALWMGVPTVTTPGDFFAARHSLSHMSNAGLTGWDAPDVEAYVALAAAKASDPAALAALRAGLRERVRASPLCDAPRFGRNLGAALRRVWREACGAAG